MAGDIDPADLEWIEKIGGGTTSEVYEGRLSGKSVAIKAFHLKEIDTPEGAAIDVEPDHLHSFRREIQAWTKLSNPNIVRFYGVCQPLSIVSELCRGGTCFDLWHNGWHIPLTWVQRTKMALDTASAMRYLHTNDPQIIHRDLKSLNLLLQSPFEGDPNEIPVVKVTDFGFARCKEQATWTRMTKRAGTSHWMAPEVQLGKDYDEMADVFSFAMILYEVVCRHVPFEDVDPGLVAVKFAKGQRPDLTSPDLVPEDTPSEFIDLMTNCWEHDAKNRPNFEQIYTFLKSFFETLK